METIKLINYIVAVLFTVCYAFQCVYIPVALFSKKKPHLPEKRNRFAVLVCARNEAGVIGQLLESIASQTYPAELVTTFVMADNCSDNTAAAARAGGAVVYERSDSEKVGKGYALEALLANIRRDYGDIYDGYFVFDADNILQNDYIEEMNRTFCDGYETVTGYRNSKNFGDNWISAGYGLWFLRESIYLNYARHQLGISCSISGTGFLFSRKVRQKIGNWPYHLLTEDIEYTADRIVQGEKIGFCRDAVLYDEQPTRFSQSWHQRMRWAKGYIQVFLRYGGRLIRGMFRGSMACYDMTMSNFPAIFLTCASVLVNVAFGIVGVVRGENISIELLSILQTLINTYLVFFLTGFLTMITERKRVKMSTGKKIRYCFTFPLFMFTYIPLSVCALFTKVTWRPIEHHAASEETRAKIRG